MRLHPSILAAAAVFALAGSTVLAQDGPQHALDLADARYQQASRETYQAQRAFDDAVARNKDAAANYEAALAEQKAAGRLLSDADVTGPRVADAVHAAEVALETERQKVAPQQARVDAAEAEHEKQLDRAMAQMPQWTAARNRATAAGRSYDAAAGARLATLYDEDEAYMDLLIASLDAEDDARALRDTPNVHATKLAAATVEWMASLDALERYEGDALAADPTVRSASDALAQATDNEQAVRARLAEQVAGDPDVHRSGEALTAARNAFNLASSELQRAQATLDAHRSELARINTVAANARQRLARVEHDIPLIQADLARSDADARRAQADLVAAQNVEAASRNDRDAIATDLASAGTYIQEPVYVEPQVIVVDGGTTIYYPPRVRHDRDHDHDRDWDHGTRGHNDNNNNPPRHDRGDDNQPHRPDRDQPDAKPPQPVKIDDATARRKQEEAKAAERHAREDAASGKEKQASNDAAAAASAARQRESSAHAEADARRQQQDAEAAARRQQQQQEQKNREAASSGSSSGGSSSSGGDRGSRYQRH